MNYHSGKNSARNVHTACEGHGMALRLTKPKSDILKEIKVFLIENENDVLTIILESYVSSDQIGKDFDNSGLSKYLYTKTIDEELAFFLSL